MNRLLLLFPLLLPGIAPAAIHDGLDEQIEHVSASITLHSSFPALYLQRAELYRLDRNFDASRGDLQMALSLGCDPSACELLRADLERDLGHTRHALKLVDGVLARQATARAVRLPGLLLRAQLLERLALPADAARAWSELLGIHPRPDPDWYLARAALQEPRAALHALEEGLRRLGNVPALLMRMSSLAEGLARPELACDYLQVLLDESPRKETWLARQGDVLQRAGLHEEAGEKYRAALQAVRTLPARLRATESMRALAKNIENRLHGQAPQGRRS